MGDKRPYADRQKIGDIIQTLRTDLGENWLLCNGNSISESEYPDLYAILSPPLWDNCTISDGSGFIDILIIGSYWVAFAVISGVTYIYYTTNPLSSWTKSTPSQTGSQYFTAVAKNTNNITLAMGTSSNLYYKSTTNPPTSWSTFTLANTGNYQFKIIRSINGTWFALGYSTASGSSSSGGSTSDYTAYNGVIFKSTVASPSGTGDWSATATLSGSYSEWGPAYAKDIIYANGFWVAVGVGQYNSYRCIWFQNSETLDGAMSVCTNVSQCDLKSIAYGNGYFVAVGQKSNKPVIVYTDNPAGTWTIKEFSDMPQGSSFNKVLFNNGSFIAVGGGETGLYAVSTNPNEWKTQQLSETQNSGFANALAINANASILVAVGSKSAWTSQGISGKLPTIAGEIYSYIKAKEDTTE